MSHSEDTAVLYNSPVLAICIPTFNRCERVTSLVSSILRVQEPFEIVVHDDGSSDGTYDALNKLRNDERLRLSRSENAGRTAATLAAVRNASAPYVMTLDDDDSLYAEGIRTIIANCKLGIPEGVGGWIYHMDFEDNRELLPFPIERSNFLALRADCGIKGDKKEVVRTDLLRQKIYAPAPGIRRAPPSLSWTRIALNYDTICVNTSVGLKRYLEGGITKSIGKIKRRYAGPMAVLYITHIEGYFKGRYRSIRYLAKALAGVLFYGSIEVFHSLRRRLKPAAVPSKPNSL